MTPEATRRTILYLAPWLDIGGSDKGTIDWFRWMDRRRHELLLATTQPSDNRRLGEVLPYAAEVWPLPDLMAGQHMPQMIVDLVHARGVEVVHVMNSRLGYELLPDLVALEHRPRIVVQLHVEEPDRSGYVRLVCTRFGNLVDAFSVSSEDLAQRMARYDVPRSKIHVIRTGIDPETEFSPRLVEHPRELGEGFHVLYPGRVAEQKDPGLMLEVAAQASALLPDLRVHVVGDGELAPDLREAVERRRLEGVVRFHPPTPDLRSWYAASDVLLMTSRYEGVPYVLYEALAMGVPAVVPALAGNVELLRGGGGRLVDPRDDVAAYVRELVDLHGGAAAEVGAQGRRMATEELSLRRMAEEHEQLYDRLARTDPPRVRRRPAPAPPPHWGIDRERRWDDPVTVVVPCFNHGRYLDACLDSILGQGHPAVDVIVVDDASTDPHTLAVLDEAAARDGVQVLHQAVNGGPSAARNRAIQQATGRYILPVDADNLLVDGAIERLTRQLAAASGAVAFVYPVAQYFGNRRDLFRPPVFNLGLLLQANYCDTCSLFDAEVFSQGVRFEEDIGLGHEDWDLMLQVVQLGLVGEPADEPVLFYRKSGFTRSDLVEYGASDFEEGVRARHHRLFGAPADYGWSGPWAGPGATIKAHWSPGMSVVPLPASAPEGAAGGRVWEAVRRQTAVDFELLVRAASEWPPTPEGAVIRTLPLEPDEDALSALQLALVQARGRWLLLSEHDAAELLGRPERVEQLLRLVVARPEVRTVAFVDRGAEGRYPLRILGPDEPVGDVHTLLVDREAFEEMLDQVGEIDTARPLASLIRRHVDPPPPGMQWRHLAGPPPVETRAATGVARARPRHGPPRGRSAELERAWRLQQQPSLPAAPSKATERWWQHPSWVPVEHLLLVRHRSTEGRGYLVTHERASPPGYVIDFDLGTVHRFQPPGTAVLRGDERVGYTSTSDADEGAPLLRGDPPSDGLGAVEEVAFPLFVGLHAGFDGASGTWTIFADLPADPLRGQLSDSRHLGFVEGFPNLPRHERLEPRPYGLVSLLRSVDRTGRRFRYGAGTAARGVVDLELGALSVEPTDGRPLRLTADGTPELEAPRADPRVAARWLVAPLAWRDTGPVVPRLRAVARRAQDAAAVMLPERGTQAPEPGQIVGWLFDRPGDGREPVYRAVHPVTADVLLTRWPLEANDLGYGPTELLGYVTTRHGPPGRYAHRPTPVPWASRFGGPARR